MCLVVQLTAIDLQFDNGGTRDAVYTTSKPFCPKSQIQWRKKFASSLGMGVGSRRRVAKVLAGSAAEVPAADWWRVLGSGQEVRHAAV